MNPGDEKLFKQDYYDDTRLGEINVLSDFTTFRNKDIYPGDFVSISVAIFVAFGMQLQIRHLNQFLILCMEGGNSNKRCFSNTLWNFKSSRKF